MTTSAVLFDLDGVLVDSASLHVRAYDQVFRDAGIEFSLAARNAVHEGKSRSEVIEIAVPEANAAIRQSLFDAKPKAVAKLLRDARDVTTPGATRMVRALAERGIAMGVVTNSVTPEIWLAVADFLEVMDVVVSGKQVSSPKPSPEGYLLAAKRLSVDPAACIAFEDSLDGCLAASRAGMRVVLLAATRPDWSDGSFEVVPALDSPRALALCFSAAAGNFS